MAGYDNDDEIFPPGLTGEEKAALAWKIEQDYSASHFGAVAFKNEYIAFAIQFYTRNPHSLEDVAGQYRAHRSAEQRRSLAQAFLADMQSSMREMESAWNPTEAWQRQGRHDPLLAADPHRISAVQEV